MPDPRFAGERFGPVAFVAPIGQHRIEVEGRSLRFDTADTHGFVFGDEWNTYSIDLSGRVALLHSGSDAFDLAPAAVERWLGRPIPLPAWVDVDDE